MRIDNSSLIGTLLVVFGSFCAALGQQGPSITPVHNDVSYHPAGFLKSPDDGRSLTDEHLKLPLTSLATLTKISILPPSVCIRGPYYSQRILVEGTFLDGHQEDVTSRATL